VTAMLGVLLNLVLGLSRVLLAMGRRGDAPRAFGRLDSAGTTPTAAVVAVGVMVALLVLVGDVRTTWSFSAFTVLVYYAVTNLAALALPAGARLFPRWVAALGFASCLGLAFFVEARVWLAGTGVLSAAVLLRALRSRAREWPRAASARSGTDRCRAGPVGGAWPASRSWGLGASLGVGATLGVARVGVLGARRLRRAPRRSRHGHRQVGLGGRRDRPHAGLRVGERPAHPVPAGRELELDRLPLRDALGPFARHRHRPRRVDERVEGHAQDVGLLEAGQRDVGHDAGDPAFGGEHRDAGGRDELEAGGRDQHRRVGGGQGAALEEQVRGAHEQGLQVVVGGRERHRDAAVGADGAGRPELPVLADPGERGGGERLHGQRVEDHHG